MHWSIVGPPGHHPANTDPNTYGPSDLHRVKVAAATAIYKLDAYRHAADARRRAGSWNPDAARSEADRDALQYAKILRGERRQDRHDDRPPTIEHSTGGRIIGIR